MSVLEITVGENPFSPTGTSNSNFSWVVCCDGTIIGENYAETELLAYRNALDFCYQHKANETISESILKEILSNISKYQLAINPIDKLKQFVKDQLSKK